MKDPLRSGEPFSDRVISYITGRAARGRDHRDPNPPDVDYVLENENPGLVRRYALPGSARCVQCHMGSPSAAFVLGFTPLPGRDEGARLQRRDRDRDRATS